MKNLFLPALLLCVVSCSSKKSATPQAPKEELKTNHYETEWNGLADETYYRWGSVSPGQSKDTIVVQCYQGKVDEALESYKKKFSTKNELPHYWLHVGNCYYIDKKWNKAEFFYRLALDDTKLSVVRSLALNNLALLMFQWEQWEKGRDYLKQSIALSPALKVPKFNLAQLHIQFGFYDRAITLLKDPVFANKKDLDVYFSLANAYLFKGDLKSAGQYFNLLPKGSFTRSDVAATYALYLIEMGQLKEAKKVLSKREDSPTQKLTEINVKIEKMLQEKLKQ